MELTDMRSTLAFAVAVGFAAAVCGCDDESSEQTQERARDRTREKSAGESKPGTPESPEPERLEPPAQAGAMAPSTFQTERGFGLSWLRTSGGSADAGAKSHALVYATWRDGEWGDPKQVVERSDMFANWADVPSVVRVDEETLLAQWPQRAGEPTYAYHLKMARSTDGGETWEVLGTPHRDETPTEHGFASMVPTGDGVLTFWLDGRAREGGSGPMRLRAAEVRPAAEAKDAVFGEERVVDERVCECCPTDAAALGDSVVALYRNRTTDEIRDIWTVRRVEGEWADPRRLSEEGWKIEGCPVNGPAVSARESTVAAAWFTEAGGEPRVRMAFSDDAGNEYTKPVRIDRSGATAVGRVDVVSVQGGAVVSWLSRSSGDDGSGAVLMRRVSESGETGKIVRVGKTSATRRAGIPRLARTDDSVVAIWRTSEDQPELRAKRYPLPVLEGQESSGADRAKGSGSTGPADTTPDLTARALGSGTVALSDVEGPLLVNLWATWCGPCKAEMPLLEKIQKRFEKEGLQMIGLSVEREGAKQKLREFVDNNEVPFDVWFAPREDALSVFGASAVPATFLYDSDGALVWWHDGKIDERELVELEERVREVLPK